MAKGGELAVGDAVAAVFAQLGRGNGETGHAGGFGGEDACGGVFQGEAAVGGDPETAGAFDIHRGVGFPIRLVLGGLHNLEIGAQPDPVQHRLDDVRGRRGGQPDAIAGSTGGAHGLDRAWERLAALLKDAGIQAVFSTDYRRTLDTAKPTAEAISKRIEIYDGDDLAAFARTLRARGDRALVVGHSDTTPELVSLLGGESGPPIDSDEFDRIYLLTLFGDGKASTTVLRFPSGVEK